MGESHGPGILMNVADRTGESQETPPRPVGTGGGWCGRAGALCLSFVAIRVVPVSWNKRIALARGQAQGHHIHPTLPSVPTEFTRFGRQRSSGRDTPLPNLVVKNHYRVRIERVPTWADAMNRVPTKWMRWTD